MIVSPEEFILLRCSDNPDEYRRAACENASEETWRLLINGYPEMRKWVAHNKTIPETIIRLLFELHDEDVKYVLARKRSTPKDILNTLAHDPDEHIRLTIARNPKVLRSTLNALLHDNSIDVQRIALYCLKDPFDDFP